MTRLRRDAKAAASEARPTGNAAPAKVRVAALRELLRDVCAAADGRDLTPRWGATDGPDAPGARFVIEPPPDRPFEAIGVVPWPDQTFGAIDVRLRGGPWDWPPLERAFGPFREEIQIGRVAAPAGDHVGRAGSAGDRLCHGLGGAGGAHVRVDPA